MFSALVNRTPKGAYLPVRSQIVQIKDPGVKLGRKELSCLLSIASQ